MNNGCRKKLTKGQWWSFCGQTDMGQTAPVLCKDCGGDFYLFEKVQDVYIPMDKEIQSLKAQNKKLRECVEFYGDEKKWRKQTQTTWTICPRDDVEYKNNHHYGIGGKKARECLKEIDSE